MEGCPRISSPSALQTQLEPYVLGVKDFPKPGILFRDITPLLASPEASQLALRALTEQARELKPSLVLGSEARGFLFGPMLAAQLGVGFVPARKPGKLPRPTLRAQYALEYGQDALEVHTDAIKPGDRVLLHDDLLATGGTARALCSSGREDGRAGCRLRLPDRATRAGGPGAAPALPGARATHLLILPGRRERLIRWEDER